MIELRYFQVFLIALASAIGHSQVLPVAHGVQMRLTSKGMEYAVQVGIKIMESDLKREVINEKGRDGDISYELQNLRVTDAVFKEYSLSPVVGTGMKGVVSGITISATGKVRYQYRKGWFKFGDTIGISMTAEGVSFMLVVGVGANADGRPTISVKECSASVRAIKLKFHGGGSFIYNLFSGLIESKMKKSFGSMMCNTAVKEITERATEELATFPVVKPIDEYAQIDYRMTGQPLFTESFMDAYLKGQFVPRSGADNTTLIVPTFATSADAERMVYFWITDYTANTAGEVYHNAGKLKTTVAAWDPKVPSEIKNFLNTNKFAFIVPTLAQRFPNSEMAVQVSSYQAPTLHMMSREIFIRMYVHAMFQVKTPESIENLFKIEFDIKTQAEVSARQGNVTANMGSFDYTAKVLQSYIGDVKIPLNNFLVKSIIDVAVVSQANAVLNQGFPLPKIDDVLFKNFEILQEQNFVRIGTDVEYSRM